MSLYDDLKTALPRLDIRLHAPLAPFTTLKIGGPGEVVAIVTKQSELFSLLKFISKNRSTPYQILGNGSNSLISDAGLPGLTIINRAAQIKISPHINPEKPDFTVTYTQRNENEPDKYLDFTKLDYDESGLPTQTVVVQAGTPLPYAINYLISQGLTGLQWFAYIPGTIGGAVYQNIHGGKYHFSDYLESIKAFDLTTGKTKILKKSELSWKYETSFFQQHPELVILSVTLKLFRGDTELAKKVAAGWIAQKSKVQPLNSAGSVFANPSIDICQKIWGEQKSAGWIIDHELGLKGHQIGGAQISPIHANFIVNTGNTTAADYKSLVSLVQQQVKAKFDFELIPEVKFLGKFE